MTGALRYRGRGGGTRAMLTEPMLRDIAPGRDEDALKARNVIEKAREACGAAGPAGETAVQPDRHHLRRALALGIEEIERIPQIHKEVVSMDEALRIDEAHVVGVEAVRDDEVRAVRAVDPIGQVVGIGVG